MEQDLERASSRIYDIAYALRRTNRRKRFYTMIFKSYIYIGLTVAIFGLGYFLVSTYVKNLTQEQALALIVTGSGIGIALMSKLILSYKSESKRDIETSYLRSAELYRFLNMWERFEMRVRKIERLREADWGNLTYFGKIDELIELKIIDNRDEYTLEVAAQARNSIIHGGSDFSDIFLDKLSRDVHSIITKLDAFITTSR